jgi:hypothetical protein
LRQLSSKAAKEQTKDLEGVEKSKELFTEHLRLATKVHIAFCKAVRKTLIDV